jgi:hypothetical protein
VRDINLLIAVDRGSGGVARKTDHCACRAIVASDWALRVVRFWALAESDVAAGELALSRP